MIPTGFPIVAPAITLGELFGPLASIAVVGVLAGLLIVVALVLTESRTRRQRPDPAARAERPAGKGAGASPLRPAA